MSKKEVFKIEVEECVEGMYACMVNDGDDFRKERILEKEKMEVRICAKIFFCGDEVGKEKVIAVTNETWLTGRGEKSRKRKVDSRGVGEEIPAEDEVGAVDGFDSLGLCGGCALEVTAAVCLEEDVGMFVHACVL